MVPEGWKTDNFSGVEIAVIDGDRGKEYPKSDDLLEDGYCVFLSAKNVTKEGFKFNDVQFISEEKHQKLRKGEVRRGNLVLTTRGTVGQFAYFDESVPRCFSRQLALISPLKRRLSLPLSFPDSTLLSQQAHSS